MKNIINKYGGKKFMEINQNDVKLKNAILLKGDAVQRIKEIESESIGFSIFSPPFASLYSYSDHIVQGLFFDNKEDKETCRMLLWNIKNITGMNFPEICINALYDYYKKLKG